MRHLLTLLLMAASAPAAEAGPLTLEITGFSSTDGMLLVAIHNGPDGFPGNLDTVVYKAAVKPQMPTTVVTFDGVPAGTYAAVAVHDENGNGVLDVRRVIPIPKEPIACSRDAKGTFGPPKYEDAQFAKPAGAHVERFSIGKL